MRPGVSGAPGTTREEVLIDVPGLRSLLVNAHRTAELSPAGLLLLDATVALAAPAHDGDYRAASGVAGWAEAHIPGSRHVDLLTRFTDPSAPYHFAHPARAAVRRELAALGAGPRTRVVLYDQGSLQWAARLWWTLRDAGVEARVLDGGLPAWTAAGHPADTGADPHAENHPHDRHGPDDKNGPHDTSGPDEEMRLPAENGPYGSQLALDADPFPRAAAQDAVRPSLWADKDQVRAISEGTAPGTLVCALSTEHFEGTTPTRYSRRGRIPASISLPAQPALTPDGRLRTVPELVRYAEQLPGGRTNPVVLYCGGGISASLGALALTLAGVQQLSVYDGSLEEWTADPARPVLTGAP
ncbi:rhodanese-like domain-containing protein [Streptomyces sp. NPDC005423]|uniref:sulfurtransferase n=1 Tax=Streptomyces sp. NPDC005423 TaxID=3155343 RepID=UPI0033A84E89